jgi:hypothetical protein
VNLFAADKVKVSDVVVDLVGDVGGVHDGFGCLFWLL